MKADLIFTYTRAQAIEDGVLVDVTSTAKEAGFKIPVAVTQRVWVQVVTPDEDACRASESETGRLCDVLMMLHFAIRYLPDAGDREEVHYSLLSTKEGKPRKVTLKALCGPGDHGEPVVTIMFPEED
ncbi:MAG: DUF6573 family protein [Bacillota bacterium]